MVATVVEEHRRAFGAWLREQRCGSEISLREAATRLGMCAAKLSRIETGGYARVTSDTTLRAFAELYAVPVEEVYAQAGLHVDPEALAAARAATNPVRPVAPAQRAVTLDATGDVYILAPPRFGRKSHKFRSTLAPPTPTSRRLVRVIRRARHAG